MPKKLRFNKPSRPLPTIPEGEDFAGSYDLDELKEALSPDEWTDFSAFMYGQTMAISHTGRRVAYAWDVDRWLNGLRVID